MQESAPLTFQNMRTHGSTLSTDQQNGSTDQSILLQTAMNIHQKPLPRTAMRIHGSSDQNTHESLDHNTLPKIDYKT